jgi:hypothetical protein
VCFVAALHLPGYLVFAVYGLSGPLFGMWLVMYWSGAAG